MLVVTCTGGERGSILNPKHGPAGDRSTTCGEVRRQEMDAGARDPRRPAALARLRRLRPAGGRPLPPLPEGCFALQPLEEAAGAAGRRRPRVPAARDHSPTTTNGGYPHPDHIMTNGVSVEAFEAAGDPDRYPGTGEPVAAAEALLPHGLHQGALRGAARGDDRARPRLAVRRLDRALGGPAAEVARSPPGCRARDYFELRDEALLAHATQVDPDGSGSSARASCSRRSGRPRTTTWPRSLVDTDAARGRPVRGDPRRGSHRLPLTVVERESRCDCNRSVIEAGIFSASSSSPLSVWPCSSC